MQDNAIHYPFNVVFHLPYCRWAIMPIIHCYTVLSPAKIEGIGEGIILGGASVHIKDFGSTPIPLQRQIRTEGMGAPYPLSMLGRTLSISMPTPLECRTAVFCIATTLLSILAIEAQHGNRFCTSQDPW